jgi:hypothetical protein
MEHKQTRTPNHMTHSIFPLGIILDRLPYDLDRFLYRQSRIVEFDQCRCCCGRVVVEIISMCVVVRGGMRARARRGEGSEGGTFVVQVEVWMEGWE